MSPSVSIQDFRSTRRILTVDDAPQSESILSYWNNSGPDFDFDEVLHIKCGPNEKYYLEIANTLHEGTLQELEEVLYQWALDEGWFD